MIAIVQKNTAIKAENMPFVAKFGKSVGSSYLV
jgi:hypothetical protein